MKEKVVAITLMLILMGSIPFAAAKCAVFEHKSDKTAATADTATVTSPQKEANYYKLLCGFVAAKYKENYSDETVKAIALIMNTNYKANPNAFNIEDKSVCLFKEKSDDKIKKIYSKFETAVGSVINMSITKNDSLLFIPYSDTSNGFTYCSEKYNYLCSVASPWDCYAKSFNNELKCVGVSLNGVDYLCKNGSSAEDALKWYLPEFEVTKIK